MSVVYLEVIGSLRSFPRKCLANTQVWITIAYLSIIVIKKYIPPPQKFTPEPITFYSKNVIKLKTLKEGFIWIIQVDLKSSDKTLIREKSRQTEKEKPQRHKEEMPM
jgi:hypothetical protein